MKVAVLLICTLAIICRALSAPQIQARDDDDEFVLTKALPCDAQLCKAPACRCSSTVLDPEIPIEKTPQVCRGSTVTVFALRTDFC